MAVRSRIQVSGLAEFRTALHRAGQKANPEVTRALREIGTNIKRETRTRMQANFVPDGSRRSGRLRSDIHVRSRLGSVEITMGERTPYAGWWEFGGNSKTPPPPRLRVKGGRSLYPALKSQRADIELRMALLLTRLGIEIENIPPTGSMGR